jgi:Na+/proline symporter
MMSRLQVPTLHLSVALLTATGAVFAWMKYFMKPSDEFAVANHPMQPWMLAAHVVIAPLAVFVLGWIFAPHIGPGIANRDAPKRTSGLWAWTPCVPMIASGYLLQVATADATRRAMAITHWIASALFVAAYAGHLLARKSTSR